MLSCVLPCQTLNVEIGDGQLDSLIMNINSQVDAFAAAVRADPLLAAGFNLIGHSQGGLISRAYIERYNDPPVFNFVSWAGPHAGVYGVPDINLPFLDQIMSQLVEGTYTTLLQETVSFAAYWKDPYHYPKYLTDNIFLADINNERPVKNATYKKNLLSLNALVLQYSPIDTIVVPNTSPVFQFFAVNQSSTVVPLNETDSYVYDWIGLQSLHKDGRLHTYEVNCTHQDFPRDDCKPFYDQFTRPFLNNTL
jgi:palmitoyl-protein thioesterase